MRDNANETSDTWRCFHCNTVFTNRTHAAEHFGADDGQTPACRLTISEGNLVGYIRKLQRELAAYRREDNYILRAWDARVAEGIEAIRKAEEAGYARGVRDVLKMTDAELSELRLSSGILDKTEGRS